MSWIDWCIVIIPMALLVWMAISSGKYARGVVDYLAAGRIAGRYVLSVGDMTAGLSVITLVAGCEAYYQTGFSVGFWGAITAPVGIFIALTGYCTYRWRQTRCLSLGQFLELRYGSKFFRIFCAALRTIAEMVTNAIGPAIATNFFIYYLGLPHKVMICGVSLPCYAIIVVLCLILAIIFIWPGGRISLLITDSIQGIFSYPIFVIIVGYIILNFSWSQDVAPVMWNRVEGQSFMNPYDISKMRDFNLFALVVSLCGSILNRAAWIGNDTTGAGKTPHEQKMAGVLGSWRNGFSLMMILLLAIITITFMTSPNFFKKNRFKVTSPEIRQELCSRVLEEAVRDPEQRKQILREIGTIPAQTEAKSVAGSVIFSCRDIFAFSTSAGSTGSDCRIQRDLPSSDTDGTTMSTMAAMPQIMAMMRTRTSPGNWVKTDSTAGRTSRPLTSRRMPSTGRKTAVSPQFSM